MRLSRIDWGRLFVVAILLFAMLMLLVVSTGCCTHNGGSRRVDIVIENKASHALYVKVKAGPLSRDVTILPNGDWRGWGYREWIPPVIKVEVTNARKKRR